MKTNLTNIMFLKIPSKPLFITLTFIGLIGFIGCKEEPSETEVGAPEEVFVDSLAEQLEEVDEIRDTLTGHWVSTKFVDEIKKNKSVFFSQAKMLPVTELIIDEEKRSIQLVFGYNEACDAAFERQIDKFNVQSCDSSAAFTYEFEYDPFNKEILLLVDEMTFKFQKVSPKTEPAGQAIERQIVAGTLLNGQWQAARAQKPFASKLQFDQKGFIRGISSYNKYKFILGYDSYPAFLDVVHLYKNANQFDAWYWQLDGDSLRFYSFLTDAPDLFEEKAVYYRLP